MRCVVVCLCLVCLFPAVSFAGPLYKWVDDKGVVHYSDRHPGSSANVKNFEDRSYPDAKPSQSADETSAMAEQDAAEEPEMMAAEEDEIDEATDETSSEEDNADLEQQELEEDPADER
ncbi:DUF4124 domain-containing protein [Desulfuromonas acetoxidans]|uniref:DUF4124 domain-containing protein n=1 Tax=Desulfuromonas acetoxidans TaxID=891 RepID=UPI00293194A0|nr:DUF4124 domain-containing protein [Desulfuromonas acetoxidans]